VAIVFDTLEYAGRLKRAGFTEQQAAAQVQALARSCTTTSPRNRIWSWSSRISLAVRQELKQDLRALEHRLTLRMGTMLAVGVVAALVKLL
jgi:hypothetical protein